MGKPIEETEIPNLSFEQKGRCGRCLEYEEKGEVPEYHQIILTSHSGHMHKDKRQFAAHQMRSNDRGMIIENAEEMGIDTTMDYPDILREVWRIGTGWDQKWIEAELQ